MTKILYIPTGEYLRYYDTSDYTLNVPTLIEIEDCRDIESAEMEIYTLTNNYNEIITASSWIKHNNLIFPILESELEIIYD